MRRRRALRRDLVDRQHCERSRVRIGGPHEDPEILDGFFDLSRFQAANHASGGCNPGDEVLSEFVRGRELVVAKSRPMPRWIAGAAVMLACLGDVGRVSRLLGGAT